MSVDSGLPASPFASSVNGLPKIISAPFAESVTEGVASPPRRNVGFVGRIVRDKGIIELVEAWKRLRDVYPDLHLLVVGPSEPQDPVPADVTDVLRRDSRIHLTGFQADAPPLYAAMDVVVLPTRVQGSKKFDPTRFDNSRWNGDQLTWGERRVK